MPKKKDNFSADNKKFLIKLNRGGLDFYANVKLAYNAKALNLNDKKRCCLITNGFTLDDFNKKYVFEVKSDRQDEMKDDTSMVKCQWFHSAIMIYTLLQRPDLAPDNSGVHALHSNGTADIFLDISREVLNSDPDGIKCVRIIDSQTEMCDEVTVKEIPQ
jgi:hypothetical protein